jgi:hypothetical protein
MTPTLMLPPGRSVTDLAACVSVALDELLHLEPTRYALGHWLCGAYKAALASSPTHSFTLRTPTDVEAMIRDAQVALRRTLAAAMLPDDFLGTLPPRVHVVRIRDEAGACGFAPLDIPGASLAARGLSLLLADYLAFPERYVDMNAASLAS